MIFDSKLQAIPVLAHSVDASRDGRGLRVL